MSEIPSTAAESTSSWMWRRWRLTLITAAIGVSLLVAAVALPLEEVGRLKLWLGLAGLVALLLLPTMHMRPLYQLYSQVGARVEDGIVELTRVEMDNGSGRSVSRGYAVVAATPEMVELHFFTQSEVVRIPADSIVAVRSLLGFFRGRIRITFERAPGRREQLLIDPVVKVVTASAGKGNVEVFGERLREMWNLPDPKAKKTAEQSAE